jgi:4-hydroxybenzoate polyprenyltransferase
VWVQGLHFFGALAIVGFAWAFCRFCGWRSWDWLPLWGAGAVLVYNADRLREDPADSMNVPLRTADGGRLRWKRKLLVCLSGGGLVGAPLLHGDWKTFWAVCLGVGGCAAYVLPPAGWRLKDVPGVKTLFAPAGVMAAVVALPVCHGEKIEAAGTAAIGVTFWMQGWGGVVWAFFYLLFNMLLCDLRDIEGDRVTGVRSIPVLLGVAGTRLLLWGIFILLTFFASVGALQVPGERGRFLGILALLGGGGMWAVLGASTRARGERFYEWAVEGLLFIPGAAWVLESLF